MNETRAHILLFRNQYKQILSHPIMYYTIFFFLLIVYGIQGRILLRGGELVISYVFIKWIFIFLNDFMVILIKLVF